MPVENHELQAIRMALAMRESLIAMSLSWRKRGHELGFGAGIAGGYVTIGTIGFEQRLDYGAIGPSMQSGSPPLRRGKGQAILIAQRVLSKVEGPHRIVEPVGAPS